MKIGSYSLHPTLTPVAFFVATFACDLVFGRTGETGFALGSGWLIGVADRAPRR